MEREKHTEKEREGGREGVIVSGVEIKREREHIRELGLGPALAESPQQMTRSSCPGQ